MLAIKNKNKNFANPATTKPARLKTKIKIKFPSQINGRKYAKNGVNGPKTIPRAKTPRLGKIIAGKIYLFGKNIADKNSPVLTIVPTSHCGWPIKNGAKNAATDSPIKTIVCATDFNSTGKLIADSFSIILLYHKHATKKIPFGILN